MSDITAATDITEDKASDITPFIVRLPLEMVVALDRAGARRSLSRNAFIRKALQRVLDGEPA